MAGVAMERKNARGERDAWFRAIAEAVLFGVVAVDSGADAWAQVEHPELADRFRDSS